MKLSPKERAARQEAFRQMTPMAKLEYIWTYFKAPILLVLTAVIILGSVISDQLAKKEHLLYAAGVNVAVSKDLEADLNQGFVSGIGANPQRAEVYYYWDLYLSDDPTVENHEYVYATRMKLIATIQAKELDLVLMNREAYDMMSRSDYLLELPELLAQNPALYEQLAPYLITNTVVIEDDSAEFNLGDAEEYVEIREDAVNGIELTQFPLFRKAAFSDSVYLGIIANSPRLDACLDYIAYLASADAA